MERGMYSVVHHEEDLPRSRLSLSPGLRPDYSPRLCLGGGLWNETRSKRCVIKITASWSRTLADCSKTTRTVYKHRYLYYIILGGIIAHVAYCHVCLPTSILSLSYSQM